MNDHIAFRRLGSYPRAATVTLSAGVSAQLLLYVTRQGNLYQFLHSRWCLYQSKRWCVGSIGHAWTNWHDYCCHEQYRHVRRMLAIVLALLHVSWRGSMLNWWALVLVYAETLEVSSRLWARLLDIWRYFRNISRPSVCSNRNDSSNNSYTAKAPHKLFICHWLLPRHIIAIWFWDLFHLSLHHLNALPDQQIVGFQATVGVADRKCLIKNSAFAQNLGLCLKPRIPCMGMGNEWELYGFIIIAQPIQNWSTHDFDYVT